MITPRTLSIATLQTGLRPSLLHQFANNYLNLLSPLNPFKSMIEGQFMIEGLVMIDGLQKLNTVNIFHKDNNWSYYVLSIFKQIFPDFWKIA